MSDTVLVGDIGGTNVRFGCAHKGAHGKPEIEDIAILPGDDFSNFGAALSEYMGGLNGHAPRQALFAFAGPVKAGQVRLTNRDWTIDSHRLAADHAFNQVRLVNDYAAMARAIPVLPDGAFQVLHPGSLSVHERTPILVSGPGTGLGQATLLPEGEQGWRVITGEGGHAAYAPRTEREWALCQALRKRHGYVSKELVLSGSGLDGVHEAVCAMYGAPWKKIPPGEILARAEADDPVCVAICEIRAAATLDAMGDAALMNGTRGGVVITGGVAERLAKWLTRPDAMARFFERGAMRDYMRPIPIRLLLSGEAALVGAAALFFDMEIGT